MGYIYKITNTINNKAYIGVTIQNNPNIRWSSHKSHNRQGNGCPLLMKAFKKHGEKAFKFEVLIICFNDDVFKFENEYIKKYNTLSPNGYNVIEGGKTKQTFLGKTHSEETKQILSEKSKIHNSKLEVREQARKNAIKFNKTHNIGELMKKSEKWQKALVERKNNSNYCTEETKNKISKSVTQYYNSINIKQKEERYKKHSIVMTKAIGKKVSQYSIEGKFIESFSSIIEAQEKTGIKRRNIGNVLSKKSKTAGGFIWKYDIVNEIISDI